MQSEFGFNKARWWSLCTSLWEAQCKVYADFTLMDAGDLGTGFPMSCYLERTKVCVCPPRAKGRIQTTRSCSFRHWPSARVGTTSKSERDPAGSWGQNIFSIHFIKTWCCSKWMRAHINNLEFASSAWIPFSKQNPNIKRHQQAADLKPQ